jgi:hypothetical protein
MSRPWSTHPTQPPASRESWKHYLGEACPHGLEIVLVDGTHVRNHHDSDFSQGGNGFRYDFVPRGELWIDVQISQVEHPLIAYHECRESELMRRGWDYERAHDRAKLLEDRLRRSLLPEVRAMRESAAELEQEAMRLEDNGERQAASMAYHKAAGLRMELGQRKRASQLYSLAIRANTPRWSDFVEKPLSMR